MRTHFTIRTHSGHETTRLGFILGREVRNYRAREGRSLVILLSGELGAGKTVFAKGVGRGLGVRATIHSPTFLLMKRYPLARSYFKNLWHIDCYRIHNARELIALGLKDILRNPKNIVVIEWPERVRRLIPRWALAVSLAHTKGDTRIIRFQS